MCINIEPSVFSSYADSLIEKTTTDSILAEKVLNAISISMDSLIQKASVDTALADKIANSYWYNFYNSAFQELIASHVGLFGALIAVAVVIFGFKYWNDNVNLKGMIEQSAKENAKKAAEEEIPKIAQNLLNEANAYSLTGTIEALLDFVDEKEFKENFFVTLLKMMQIYASKMQGKYVVSLMYCFEKILKKMDTYNRPIEDIDLKGLLKDVENSIDISLQAFFATIINENEAMYKQLRCEWEKIRLLVKNLIGSSVSSNTEIKP